ncbi:MAG: hypothetical protein EOO67_13830, partial [Microbacterium sp.]
DETIVCDVVIVGSGAGGGTAAGVLAAAGLDVVILEAGEYHDDRDFDGSERTGFSQLYAGAPGVTSEGQVQLVAGRGLGGGTVVNYTTSFPTPDHVRAEWASMGSPQFTTSSPAAASTPAAVPPPAPDPTITTSHTMVSSWVTCSGFRAGSGAFGRTPGGPG